MNLPSRSSTETGIVTRLVSTFMISSSPFPGGGVVAVDGRVLRLPPCKTGGALEAVGLLGSLTILGGVAVGTTRGRVPVFVCAAAPKTRKKRKLKGARYFIGKRFSDTNCFGESARLIKL